MIFYPSRTRDTLNGYKPVHFERLVGRAMLNPRYPIRCLAPDARVLFDSGAFQDVDAGVRLFPWTALERQLAYIRRLRVYMGVEAWLAEALFIYDQMAGVDEAIVNGRKVKVRGTRETAQRAVEETLQAARYYASQRETIATYAERLAFVGQGIDPDQYVNDCVRPMMEIMHPGDWFAFGGFCIIGRQRSLLPVFYETFVRVLDILIPFGIRRFHLLGVCIPEAVTFAAKVAAGRGVVLSTDSSAIELASVISGAVYVDGRKKKGPWTKAQKGIDYCPTQLAHDNIVKYSAWALGLGANEADDWDLEETEQIGWAHSQGLDPLTLAPVYGGNNE